MKSILVWVFVIALVGAVCYTLPPVEAQPKAQWVMEGCDTLEQVTALLNRLPPDRATDAKVTTINSQRSFMGVLSTPYYVWYRK